MNASARVTIEPEASDRPQRRKHSIAEKRRIVEATLAAGASVALVARENGVNANQVFGWRRLYQRGLLGGNVPSVALVPVKVTESAAAPVPPDPATAAAPTGSIQLRLPKGQLRIDGAVDAALLRVLVECLLR
jgi:transposase